MPPAPTNTKKTAPTPSQKPPSQKPPSRPPTGTRAERRGRRVAWVVALVSLVTLGFSGYHLATRIRDYNKAAHRTYYVFRPISGTDFTFAGKPVHITDDVNDKGEGTLTVTYGDDTLTLPVTVPGRYALPGMERHRDWFRVQAFAEFEPPADEFKRRFEAGELDARMVIVTRTPMGVEPAAEGHFDMEVPEDDWGWAEVRRDRWLFTFYEFLPEGGFREESLRFPESGASFYRRQVRAKQHGDPPPQRRDDELKEYTWEYQAALPLMNRPPGITHEQQALRNAGWTLPVASCAVLGIMFSLAWAVAPARVRA